MSWALRRRYSHGKGIEPAHSVHPPPPAARVASIFAGSPFRSVFLQPPRAGRSSKLWLQPAPLHLFLLEWLPMAHASRTCSWAKTRT
jgi:hypothetical protein